MSAWPAQFLCLLLMSGLDSPPEQIRNRLKEHVQYLAGEIGERNSFRYENLERALSYIEQSLAETGYSIGNDVYQVGGREYRNVIGEKKGISSPEKIFVVGAHYDTAPDTPGADDNASGVASLLELARLLYSESPALTLRFVAFNLEEPPYFRTPNMGSCVHARRCREKKEPIAGMISLEMVGYYDDRPGSQRFPLPLMSWFYPERGISLPWQATSVRAIWSGRWLTCWVSRIRSQSNPSPCPWSPVRDCPTTGLSGRRATRP